MSLKSILRTTTKTRRRASTASNASSDRFSSVAGSCCGSHGSSCLKRPTRRPSLTESCGCSHELLTLDSSVSTYETSNIRKQEERKSNQPEEEEELYPQERPTKPSLAKNFSSDDCDASPRTTIRFALEALEDDTTVEGPQAPPIVIDSVDNNNDDDLHSKPGEICFEEEEEEEDDGDRCLEKQHLPISENTLKIPTETTATTKEEEQQEEGGATRTATSNSGTSSNRLTEARVRSFMIDYYEDFDSIFQTTAPASNNNNNNDGSSTDGTTSNTSQRTRKECMKAFVDQYFTPDFSFIRPSGNPLDGPGFATLMAEHIVVSSMKLVSIDSIQFIGKDAAIVVFTADQQFSFKGKPQRDRTIVTAALSYCSQEGGVIKIAHKHRSPGIPIPKTTRWA